MPWVKVDDHFPEHLKLAQCGELAALCGWLFVCGLAYCNRQLTDGRIPKGHVHALANFHGVRIVGAGKQVLAELAAERLVRVGFWEDAGDAYLVHDFLKYQPSKDEVLTEREAVKKRVRNWRSKRRGKKGGNAIGNGGGNAACNAVTNGGCNATGNTAGNADVTPSTRYPVPEGVKNTPSMGDGEVFWEAWRTIAKAHGVEIRVGMSHLEFDHLDSLMAAYTLDEFQAAAEVYWQAKGSHSLAIFRSRIADDLAKANEAQREAVAILERPTTWTCKHCGRIHETPRRDYLAQKCPAQEVA